MTEPKRRQGQKKPNGRIAIPKPICPECGEMMIRTYTRGNAERKRAYVPAGWSCPSSTCYYIEKDYVELEDTEEGEAEI
ncbi:MAG TPA: hypothetical protein VKL21_05465 [Candidatus Methanoperedens sp.]|jgi:hypothetical protein|nr:hypothetical protein [Candidatus Methanoperedens sp.]